MADSDHYFSQGFEERMLSLATRTLDKDPYTVLVYRIFEVDKKVKPPKTKSELLKLYNNETAREFHKIFFNHHKMAGQEEWFTEPENSTPSVQLVLPYNDSRWEPQFVSTKLVPLHDESFVYPIKDNTVLRWEMCRAGFKFAVVHNVFMYHLGFKSSEAERKVHRLRKKMVRRAKNAVAMFNQRMDQLFPTTQKVCPVFQIRL
ncbi:unnamed protein product [Bursaphelenchus okinawaensis]|uniref:N-acetyllactosaminide beta-1,3-N-acetylglucosaminyltransferase n=1 Tax=Bursaphelenchus okinawaensis TaxID=465554 RepID=A0A811JSN3_9BILA|nr:unnamed protein product [Bursaphelenchus okinawaensis]CAG9081192.1 unnamed protein product [Bursaphelenchus okinawaensis]